MARITAKTIVLVEERVFYDLINVGRDILGVESKIKY